MSVFKNIVWEPSDHIQPPSSRVSLSPIQVSPSIGSKLLTRVLMKLCSSSLWTETRYHTRTRTHIHTHAHTWKCSHQHTLRHNCWQPGGQTQYCKPGLLRPPFLRGQKVTLLMKTAVCVCVCVHWLEHKRRIRKSKRRNISYLPTTLRSSLGVFQL